MFEKLKAIGGKEFSDILLKTVGILAFVAAFNFFNSTPSLKVVSAIEGKQCNNNLLHAFYKKNQLEVPKPVRESYEEHWLFDNSGTVIGMENPLIDWMKQFNMFGDDPLTYFKQSKKIISSVRDNLNLEKYDNNSWHNSREINKPLPIPGINHELFSKKIDELKSHLSQKEYFTFLVGLNSSLVFLNAITIENDGDIDLRNLILTIPYPLSRIN